MESRAFTRPDDSSPAFRAGWTCYVVEKWHEGASRWVIVDEVFADCAETARARAEYRYVGLTIWPIGLRVWPKPDPNGEG